MASKIPLIYIIGSGHCGSTLLDLILDCHSKIIGIGELYKYSPDKSQQEKMICSCGKKVIDCDFWQKVLRNINPDFNFRIHRNKKNFLLNKKRIFEFDNKKGKIGKEIDSKDYIKIHERIYQKILDVSGKSVIVDSSKDPDIAEILLNSNKLDIVLLHLVRDGKAVTWSYRKIYKNVDKPVRGDRRWFFKNLKTEIIRRRNKVKYIFISYEKFCKDPEKYLKIILKKLNLSFEPEMLNFRDKVHHQVGGNRLRFAKDKEIKLDKAWKKQMPFLDKIKFNLIFGWLNLIYKIKS